MAQCLVAQCLVVVVLVVVAGPVRGRRLVDNVPFQERAGRCQHRAQGHQRRAVYARQEYRGELPAFASGARHCVRIFL